LRTRYIAYAGLASPRFGQTVPVTSRRIALCTSTPTHDHDAEAPQVVAELRNRGCDAVALPWDSPVDWSGFDLVVVRSTWDYFDRLAEFLAWVDRVADVSRIINSPSVIRWNSHKGYLAELGAAGIPVVPALALPGGTSDAVAQLQASGWTEVVIKPAVDGGARRALKAGSGSPEASAHVSSLVAAGDTIVQPYLAGVEDGETSLFIFDGTFSHAVRKVPKPGDYRVQALHGGSEEVHEPSPDELALAAAAIALAPGEVAYARADFVEVDGHSTLMELELIEPDLFLRMAPGSVSRFADLVERRLA
jgi:glutathione synthase/RimK-type ligase-like ATP-grasp enzyme